MQILSEIIIVLSLAAVVVFLCQKLRIPAIVGFLITGVVAGPSALAVISEMEAVEMLAEIGIILLMFTIGMEFSLNRLFSIRKTVFLGGFLQVALTLCGGTAWALSSGLAPNQSLLIGLMLALSSTAIVLKLMAERAEIDTPHGRTALGILIFQDILIVPAMLVIPLLSGKGLSTDTPLQIVIIKVLLAIPAVWILGKYIVPMALKQVAGTRNQELFMLSILVIGFAIAGFSDMLGLKLALGAFLAGLIISESEYSHQALGSIMPFRDVFLSFFFISIGMLLDLHFIADKIGLVLLITLGVIAMKTLTATIAGRALGYPFRTTLLSGLALSQVGEFSLLLSKAGLEEDILSQESYQLFLAVAIATMASAPVFIGIGPRVVGSLAASLDRFRGKTREEDSRVSGENNHLLIIGFGLTGRNLSTAAQKSGITHAIIEMNPETVRAMQAKDLPIHFGDASNSAVLKHAGAHLAKVAVVAINDAAATRRIVEQLRRQHPGLHIITRTRFVSEVSALYRLGADEVIPEEFETAVEIFSRVMRRYLISHNEIERLITEIRSGGYQMLRSPEEYKTGIGILKPVLEEVDIEAVHVDAGSSFAGQPLSALRIRADFGVSILTIQRNGKLLANPGGDEILYEGDRLVLMGKAERLHNFIQQVASHDHPNPK